MTTIPNNSMQITKACIGSKENRLLLERLEQLNKKIMIVGDIGLDEYLIGEVHRISPEAPVPILEVDKEDLRLGLAANVAQNVVSLGGEPILISVVGADYGADKLFTLFESAKVPTTSIVVDAKRPTTRKTRVLAQHHHIVRVDHELRKYISRETEDKLLAQVRQNLDLVDAVILQDYAKGVVTQRLVDEVVLMAKEKNKMVLVDPHRSNSASFYGDVDLMKPNFDEGVALSGLKFDELRENPHKVIEVGKAVQKLSRAKTVILTRGKEGMTIFNNGEIVEVPTYAKKVFDVTGAGDTVIATLALALSSNFNMVEACMLANFAAGVVVGKIGCVPCDRLELRDYIHTYSPSRPG